MRKNKGERIDGIVLIDKPPRITSHDVVDAARKILKTRKIGHTGTLDPFATGLLILCVEKATRLAQFIAAEDKIYRGRITLGIETDTYDSDGKVISSAPTDSLTRKAIRSALADLTGRTLQHPPPFSAKKISGKRAYELARKGEVLELEPARIRVDYFKIISCTGDHFDFETKVSAGTYIRSLAHDLGAMLGCGAHLSRLQRRACGNFRIRKASKLSTLKRLTPSQLKKKVIPLAKISLALPRAVINLHGSSLFSHGNPVPFQHIAEAPETPHSSRVAVYSNKEELLGIGIFSGKTGKSSAEAFIQPTIVLS